RQNPFREPVGRLLNRRLLHLDNRDEFATLAEILGAWSHQPKTLRRRTARWKRDLVNAVGFNSVYSVLVAKRRKKTLPHLAHPGLSFVVFHRAPDDDLPALQVPIHVAREPETIGQTLATEGVDEFPDRPNQAAEYVHCFGQVHVGFSQHIIRLIHPEAPRCLVDEFVFDVSLWQFLVRGSEVEYQHWTSVDHLAPGQGELKATEQ